MKKDKAALETLMNHYRLWGIVAMGAFGVLVTGIFLSFYSESVRTGIIFFVLLLGFLWIGATSICRHLYVTIKDRIGKKVGVIEFLSTQLIVLWFPFVYRKLKREVDAYRQANHSGPFNQ